MPASSQEPATGDPVARHYSRPDLASAILEALAAAGKDLDALEPADLAPMDEFHVRGREATLELARTAGLGAGTEVLDVGCGLGGPSRLLALEFGCSVTGVDLTQDYCSAAEVLTERLGLEDSVRYCQADALDLPFEPNTFEAVWTQHAAMNIEDKPRLYSEMVRVLRPGGLLAIYDVCAGDAGPVHFPVPWAREPEQSHLVSQDELRTLLVGAGLEPFHWKDTTAKGLAWFQELDARAAGDTSHALGFHLLMGADFTEMAANMVQNLAEDRASLVEVLARKIPR